MSGVSIRISGASFNNTVGIVVSGLFAAGQKGVWLDPSDLTTLFQDSAGTTPVTAPGDPVGLIVDKSGNSFSASQSTSANRPTYQVDGGGHPYLSFDGANDFMSMPGAVGVFRNKSAGFLSAAVLANGDTQSVGSWLNNGASSRANISTGVSGVAARAVGRNTDGSTGVTATVGSRPLTPFVMSGQFRWMGQQVIARFNGTAGTPVALAAAANTSDTDSAEACIGKLSAGGSGTSLLNGRLYSFIALDYEPAASQIVALERQLGRKCGVNL